MCIDNNVDRSKQLCYTSIEIAIGGMLMSTSEICKDLISRSGYQQKEVAEKMGFTQQSFCNKLRRNSLSADEFIKLIGIIGYEVKIVEVTTSEEVRSRRKGVGKRLQMMVNGVRYDTAKADAICHSDESEDLFCELYQNDDGTYFVAQYVTWDGGVSSITPIGYDDAQRIIAKLS